MSGRKKKRGAAEARPPTRQVVPRSAFKLRIGIRANGSGADSRVEVAVRVKGDDFRRYACSGPPLAELKEWARGTSASLSKAMAAFVRFGGSRDEPVVVGLHMDLQRAGHTRFERLFRPRDPEESTVEEIAKLLESPRLQSVEFDGATEIRGFCIEALHFRGGTELDATAFLGMRAPVVHMPVCSGQARAPDHVANVGVLASAKLTTVQDGDMFLEFTRLVSTGRLREAVRHTPLKDAHGLVPEVAGREELYTALARNRPAIWHLSSHMEDHAGEPAFTLDHGAKLSVRDFGVKGCPRFKGEPLVLVNICSSGECAPAEDLFLPDLLLLKSAAGVVAPVLLVDERFAVRFADQFYRELLDGAAPTTVAKALAAARVAAFDKLGTLAGLGYAFHAFKDFQLVPGEPVPLLASAA